MQNFNVKHTVRVNWLARDESAKKWRNDMSLITTPYFSAIQTVCVSCVIYGSVRSNTMQFTANQESIRDRESEANPLTHTSYNSSISSICKLDDSEREKLVYKNIEK